MTEKRNDKGQFEKGHINSEENRKKHSESFLGNTYAKKLKSPELKTEAYKSYCEHLAKGKSKKSWYFEHPEVSLLWHTMEKYIEAEPEVFDPLKKEIAWAKGYQYWESVAEHSAEGINEKANTASLQMVMRNKFGWDKENNESKESKATLVEKFLDKLDQLDDSDQS